MHKYLKKIIFACCIAAISPTSFISATQDSKDQKNWADIAQAAFLLGAGSWLAHKQLPRLSGKQIEFNAPVFTKIGASILFSIGITGGIVGAYQLASIFFKKNETSAEKKMISDNNITFTKATIAHKETIFNWLTEPHVIEFWDNTPEHKKDIEIFIKGRQEKSPYYNGMFDYWVGLVNNEPCALIMTAEVVDEPKLKQSWREQLSKTGRTLSIDFMIGDTKFLGKGLAAPILFEFMQLLHTQIDAKIDTFIIDPNENNPRAKRVYEKAGFNTISMFSRRGENFYLMVKKISY